MACLNEMYYQIDWEFHTACMGFESVLSLFESILLYYHSFGAIKGSIERGLATASMGLESGYSLFELGYANPWLILCTTRLLGLATVLFTVGTISY